MKKYILFAGVNGAGKSTLYNTNDSFKGMERVNSDEIVKSFGDWKSTADSLEAGKIAIRKINELFSEGVTFNQETTLCGKAIIKNISKAKKLGYIVEIHYVGVDSVEIAKERVAHRVKNGGHGIPEIDIERRYSESFKSIKSCIDLVDLVVMYDNTDCFRRFAIYKNGKKYLISNKLPFWYKNYIDNE